MTAPSSSSRRRRTGQSVAFSGLLLLAVTLPWSTAGFSLGCILAFLGGLIGMRKQSFRGHGALLGFTILWALALMIGAGLSPAPGAWDEVRGYYPLLLLFAAMSGVPSPRHASCLAIALAVSAAAAGIHAGAVHLGWLTSDQPRFSGPVTILTYSAIMATAYLSTAILFLWTRDRRLQVLWILLSLAHLEGLVMNGSRAGFAGVSLGLLVLFVVAAGRRKPLLLFLTPMLLTLPFLVQSTLAQRFLELGQELTAEGEESSQRRVLWHAAERMFQQNPVLGVGPGNFRAELDRMTEAGELEGYPLVDPKHLQAHSSPLHVAAILGLSGLIPASGWFLTLALRLWRRRRGDSSQGTRRPLSPTAVAGLVTLAIFAGFSVGDTSLRNSRLMAMMAVGAGIGLAAHASRDQDCKARSSA